MECLKILQRAINTMSALFDFQQAVYNTLKVDLELIALVSISDIELQGNKKDYITINKMTATPYRTHSRKGETIRYDILIVTDALQEFGSMRNKLVNKHVDRLLGDVRIQGMTDFHNIVSYSEGYTPLSNDGETVTGLASFRSLVLDCIDRLPLT